MKIAFHPSYKPALLIGACLQVSWLAFLYFCTYHIFLFAVIPTAAYWVITPIIIVRHPQPTELDLSMVRSGYFVYCILGLLMACAYTAFH